MSCPYLEHAAPSISYVFKLEQHFNQALLFAEGNVLVTETPGFWLCCGILFYVLNPFCILGLFTFHLLGLDSEIQTVLMCSPNIFSDIS